MGGRIDDGMPRSVHPHPNPLPSRARERWVQMRFRADGKRGVKTRYGVISTFIDSLLRLVIMAKASSH